MSAPLLFYETVFGVPRGLSRKLKDLFTGFRRERLVKAAKET